MRKEKEREFLKSEMDLGASTSKNLDVSASMRGGLKKPTIGDLFSKYNI